MGIEDQLRKIEEERSRQDALKLQQLASSDEKAVIANRLLRDLAQETLVALRKRNWPKGLEITSLTVKGHLVRSGSKLQLASGQVFTVLHPTGPWGNANSNKGISEAGELISFGTWQSLVPPSPSGSPSLSNLGETLK